jgi:hypothetical protein
MNLGCFYNRINFIITLIEFMKTSLNKCESINIIENEIQHFIFTPDDYEYLINLKNIIIKKKNLIYKLFNHKQFYIKIIKNILSSSENLIQHEQLFEMILQHISKSPNIINNIYIDLYPHDFLFPHQIKNLIELNIPLINLLFNIKKIYPNYQLIVPKLIEQNVEIDIHLYATEYYYQQNSYEAKRIRTYIDLDELQQQKSN